MKTEQLTPRQLATLPYPLLSEMEQTAKRTIKKCNEILLHGKQNQDQRTKIEIEKISFEIDLRLIKQEIQNRCALIPNCIFKKLYE